MLQPLVFQCHLLLDIYSFTSLCRAGKHCNMPSGCPSTHRLLLSGNMHCACIASLVCLLERDHLSSMLQTVRRHLGTTPFLEKSYPILHSPNSRPHSRGTLAPPTNQPCSRTPTTHKLQTLALLSNSLQDLSETQSPAGQEGRTRQATLLSGTIPCSQVQTPGAINSRLGFSRQLV